VIVEIIPKQKEMIFYGKKAFYTLCQGKKKSIRIFVL